MPFPASNDKASKPFELVHYDIWGAYRVSSFCGAHYFPTIMDDASRAVSVYLMKTKGEASQLV